MASVLNRTTVEFLASVNTPDFPTQDWIINPDLTAVAGQPTKYWVITGDVVSLMDAAARAVVDAAELEASRDDTTDRVDDVEDILRASLLVILDEFNTLRALHGLGDRTIAQMKTGIRNKLGNST